MSHKNRQNSTPLITFFSLGTIFNRFWTPPGLLCGQLFGTFLKEIGKIRLIGCSWVSVECSRVDFTSILRRFYLDFSRFWADLGLICDQFFRYLGVFAACSLCASWFASWLSWGLLLACFLPASCWLLLPYCLHLARFLLASCFLLVYLLFLSCLLLAATKHNQQPPFHRAFRSLLSR